MQSDYDTAWLDRMVLRGPAKSFAKFAAKEVARRSGTEEDFDAEHYEDAIKLVLQKLERLDDIDSL